MNLSCPHRHLSYSQYRYLVLSQLCKPSTIAQISAPGLQHQRFGGWKTTTNRRYYSSDVRTEPKESSPLPEQAVPTVGEKSNDAVDEVAAGPDRKPPRPRRRRFDPYSEQGRKDLKQLVDGLKILSQDAHAQSQKEEFRGREAGRQKNRADLIPESPVLRRMAVKRESKKRPTSEQTALMNDPWAKILASPVRLCQATHARLPIRLLTNWGLMTHPENDDIFVMPTELADLENLEKTLEWKEEKKNQLRETWKQRAQDNKGVNEATRADDESIEAITTLEPVSPSNLFPGTQPAIRITPYATLIRLLSTEFTKPDPRSPGQMMTSAGSVAGKIFPHRWHRRLAAAKYYLHQRSAVEQATGLKDFRPPPVEAQIDERRLKWQWDVEERLLDVLRRRVLLAFERAAMANATEKAKKMRRISAVSIRSIAKEELTTGESYEEPDEILNEAALMNTTRDGGDASLTDDKTSENNTAENLQDQNLPPPSADSNLNSSNYRPLASRFFIHIGANPLPTTYPFQTEPSHSSGPSSGLSQSSFTPPMIYHATTHQSFPVFPLHDMLDAKHYAEALKITQQHSEVLRIQASDTDAGKDPKKPDDDEDYMILVKVRMAYTEVLLAELWRLWRYIGGRNGIGREGV